MAKDGSARLVRKGRGDKGGLIARTASLEDSLMMRGSSIRGLLNRVAALEMMVVGYETLGQQGLSARVLHLERIADGVAEADSPVEVKLQRRHTWCAAMLDLPELSQSEPEELPRIMGRSATERVVVLEKDISGGDGVRDESPGPEWDEDWTKIYSKLEPQKFKIGEPRKSPRLPLLRLSALRAASASPSPRWKPAQGLSPRWRLRQRWFSCAKRQRLLAKLPDEEEEEEEEEGEACMASEKKTSCAQVSSRGCQSGRSWTRRKSEGLPFQRRMSVKGPRTGVYGLDWASLEQKVFILAYRL